MKHVHLIGVAGTGMGALAGLLRKAGYRVTGSDTAFYPPMGDKLAEWGVETRRGYSAEHLTEAPDLVVIGNVCRRDNPEARAAIDGGLPYLSMPGVLEELFLSSRQSFVMAGTHGKTTTTALVTHLLRAAGKEPSYLLGGVPRGGSAESFGLGPEDAPFVIEGDEYDSAFFEKQPKFFRYRPFAVVLTSIEHDHIDIYPTLDAYRDAFRELVRRMPEHGLLVAYAGDPEVRAIAKHARCRVRYYALDGEDTGDVTPEWLGALAPRSSAGDSFDLFFGGSACGRVHSPLSGEHNVKNVLGALAVCAEGATVSVQTLTRSLMSFQGVKRRQELVAVADGVRIYDDFAHHPTAVRETLAAFEGRHPEGRVIALFEPRSATASRKIHQGRYVDAFAAADLTLLAPVGRKEIAAEERLDVARVAEAIRERGRAAEAPADHDAIVGHLVDEARPGDTLVVMSNGSFEGIIDRIVTALALRGAARQLTASAP
jgi:UDP-N-acetylmuramate: L-alanyl-gamma-D-glutamyl-meso-diaminopimelate ligase